MAQPILPPRRHFSLPTPPLLKSPRPILRLTVIVQAHSSAKKQALELYRSPRARTRSVLRSQAKTLPRPDTESGWILFRLVQAVETKRPKRSPSPPIQEKQKFRRTYLCGEEIIN